MVDSMENFINEHDNFRLNQEKTRIVCTITGHELPCSIAAIRSYMNGKKYKQLTRNGTCNLSKVAEYRKYLVPSRNGKNMLYCIVTRKEINNIPSHIENHITGRKFQRDLRIYLKNHGESETSNVKDESSDADLERNVEEDEKMEEEEEEEEEVGEDNGVEREEVEGFVGGIWYPNGKDFSKITMKGTDIDMDAESAGQDQDRTDAGEITKNARKRKVKDNKKSKILLGVNKKKSR